ncbi:DHH family phosphoesterase [Spiroplasma alleghenense]|uniref:Bifunctional oligoribonuclease and PAP phosphatase NrnA n=1 Tax=Spiroplasma alleghenense TaxID=216931 RepID=A0A345Z2T5_9MOLU|nr:bifunctional oligoribonuclease/PAP phosphatase NrnA [Spiroplasma alleghenense]AXK50914.1 bifunctional oligoribonuclease and PAP phosphatase NrnA [Spiroplasma alleghenense]
MRENYKILEEKIKKFRTIIIAKHVHPDFDAIGSAFGLKSIIEDNFESKEVFVVGSTIDGGLYENPKLNDQLISESLLITCDTANRERIDFDSFDSVKEVFKIDHHVDGDDFASNELIDKTAIACCQMITIWANSLDLIISPIAANHLFKGIITDSNRFMYENTNAQTFEAAGILINAGAKFTEIYDSLYIRNWKVQKWINYCFAKAELKNDIAYIKVLRKEYIDLGLSLEEVKSCLGSICGIQEVKISILAIEVENDIKLSLRSSIFSVNQIAKKFNGGGHRLAAACKIKSWEEFEEVLQEAQKIIKSEEKNVK